MKENKILVSVLCLAFNHEKYIKNTLDGFVNQKTNFRYEVIVHDDASTDNTKKIISAYVEKYPDIFIAIYQKENQYSKGVSIIGEYMLPLVRGEYIAVCEGDDYWIDSEKLQKQIDIMENKKRVSLCVHKTKCIDEDGSENERTIPEPDYCVRAGIQDKEQLYRNIWIKGGYPFHTSSFVFQKKILEERYSKEAQFAKYINGDQVYIRLALLKGDIFYLNEEMSCRRLMSVGNWNSTFLEKSIKEKLVYWKKCAQGEILFDKYSNYKYHSYIKIAVVNNVLSWVYYDVKEARNFLKKIKPSYELIVRNLGIKIAIRYLLCKYCPWSLRIIGRIKLNVKNG